MKKLLASANNIKFLFLGILIVIGIVLGNFFIVKGASPSIPRTPIPQGPGSPVPSGNPQGGPVVIPPAPSPQGPFIPPQGPGSPVPPGTGDIPPASPDPGPGGGGGLGGAGVVPVFVVNPVLPVWVVAFNSCTAYETSLTKSLANLFADKQLAERRTQMEDIIKAREDVNKLVATVYTELRTQQVALNYGELRDILPSLGIAVTDDNTDEICKASYQVKAKVGGQEQCIAVVQEARIITNQDDYIYEESRRRAMDMLFCYLGDWRHFPIANINDPSNCEQLGIGIINQGGRTSGCTQAQVWEKLGTLLGTQFTDGDGTKSPLIWDDDQSVFNLCEGMRALGLKCAQDMLRDYVKYSTVDKITRKDRTVILAPPQTWYTPQRCRIIDTFLPSQDQILSKPGHDTPYTKTIKSLDSLVDKSNARDSFELTNILFGSKFGNPTITKPPGDMPSAEYTISKELQGINVPENNFSGLASKTEQLANQVISEVTDLRKLQYTTGQGLRDATLRIGWQDYEWTSTNSLGSKSYLGKYAALDLVGQGAKIDPNFPNKIYRPLLCYWGSEESTAHGCWSPDAIQPTGKYFYFDTGLVVAPISITKDKLEAAIKAQFDLAAKAFDDRQAQGFSGSCGAFANGSTGEFLPAPWEDSAVDLSQAINPLTGEPYTTGTPGPNNPSFRIPDLPNNYFNFFYNDVFQLYHTPFPDVLAHWFRVNGPAYDSIYGLGEPPDLTAIFQGLGPGGAGPHGPPPPPGPTGPLPTGCSNFDFSGQGQDKCLLEAIAAAESSCNPNAVSSHGACGLMQILPSTASALAGRTVTCQELQSNPNLSIQLAARYLDQASGIIAGYSSKGFSIGIDDLIASYNAGYGDKCGSPKQPFCPSTDCPSPPTPSWQCTINPGGFAQTQVYVQRVQNYIQQCQAGTVRT